MDSLDIPLDQIDLGIQLLKETLSTPRKLVEKQSSLTLKKGYTGHL